MWTRRLLKENAKIAFRRNYLTCVLVCAVSGLISSLVTNFSSDSEVSLTTEDLEILYDPVRLEALIRQTSQSMLLFLLMSAILAFVLSLVSSVFVTNILTIGNHRYFLENREHRVEFTKVFYGFRNGRYWPNVRIMLLRILYVWGWSLLFVIPGIVKAYSYMLVPYILAENTYMDRQRVFELSGEMMKGHKWEAFKLEFSFFGWMFLSAMTGGLLGSFYVNPYWSATFAEFYSAIKAEAKAKGIFTTDELPGVSVQTENVVF